MWAYDFVLVRTHDGRGVRLLTVMDEYTRECLAIRADHHIRSAAVIETLAELMMIRGVPDHIRSAKSMVERGCPRMALDGLEDAQ